MPSGDEHTAVNLGVLALTAGAGLALAVPHGVLVAFGGGMLVGTLLITPDLDLAGHVRVRVFVRHRGVTHTFLRGPALLLGYAGAVLSVILGALLLMARAAPLATPLPDLSWAALPRTDVLAALGGYLTAYWLHVWLDGYRPWHKGRW